MASSTVIALFRSISSSVTTVAEAGTPLTGSSSRVAVTTIGAIRISSWPEVTGGKRVKIKKTDGYTILLNRWRAMEGRLAKWALK